MIIVIFVSLIGYAGLSILYYKNLEEDKLVEIIVREQKKGYTNLNLFSRLKLVMLIDLFIKKRPYSTLGYHELGHICEVENIPSEYAILFYRKAIQLGSGSGLKLHLAKILLNEGKDVDALKYVDQIYQTNNVSWSEQSQLAEIYYATGYYKKALDAIKMAIEGIQIEIDREEKDRNPRKEVINFFESYKAYFLGVYYLLKNDQSN